MFLKAKSSRLALVILAALSSQGAFAEEKNQLTIVSFYL
jgi:peptide/nickel transport system substrate-binding protein